eukprot:8486418-Prorocentrum_lima.AAC.1
MTSSLVGSEMCIRDSIRKAEALLAGVHASSVQFATSIARAWFPWFTRLPVSYTHLTLPTICSV